VVDAGATIADRGVFVRVRDEIMRTSMIAIGLAAAAALGALAVAPASAQESSTRPGLHRRPPLRIVVTPSRPAQRQCVDWHVIERRASGDTVVPRSHCWWVAR
jgi:hypothetical protein